MSTKFSVRYLYEPLSVVTGWREVAIMTNNISQLQSVLSHSPMILVHCYRCYVQVATLMIGQGCRLNNAFQARILLLPWDRKTRDWDWMMLYCKEDIEPQIICLAGWG
jgi:hypothetical protein